MSSVYKVALVGRPNVGKSTLFNRIIGGRHAVVSDIAGTTRDRLERPVDYKGKRFVLVDMAGLEPALSDKNEISQGMQRQVERALKDSSAIIWVTDAVAGLTPSDEMAAELLRRQHKPVVVAVNKADNSNQELGQYEFSRFGFETMVPISAIHGRNVETLLDALVEALPEEPVAVENDDRELRLAIVGRPNVGKSTLLNAMTHDFRSVTSAIGGTTRDAVDTVLSATEVFGETFTKWKTVRLIDTAGIRRRGKIDRSIEGWSVLRSYAAIDAAEVVLFVIDATEKLVHQDLQVANRVTDAGRALVLVVNKWDAVLEAKGFVAGTPEDDEAQSDFLNDLREQMAFMPWVQVLFLSALTGTNVHVIGKLVLNAYVAWSQDIDQNELDELAEQLKKMPRLKNLRRITYEHASPPVFFLHVHGEYLPHFSTNRYVENALRDFFNMGPTPIKIWTQTQSTRKQKKEAAE
jgi:GTPase